MARPAVYMLTPNNGVITFDTLDQASEWLEQQRESHEYFRSHPEVAADG